MTSVPVTSREVVRQHAIRPAEVLAFCEDHQLFEEVAKAVQLLQDAFPLAGSMVIEAEQDADTNEQWLMVRASVHDEPAAALQTYREALRRWVQQVAWPASSLVCLSYTLA
jgi:hypothetical protein